MYPQPMTDVMTRAERTPRDVLQQALFRILRSLARVAIRYGVSAGAMGELVRRAYVAAAEETLADDGRSALTSRLCALTGLYRKEIVRIRNLPPLESGAPDDRYDRSARVVSGWTRDVDFLTRRGRPAVLRIDGEHGFEALVRRYSGDMTPRAMLEELERLKAIERTASGGVRLVDRAYVPESSELDVLQILGTDTADLVDTVHYNVDKPRAARRFQRKVSYVHIPERHLEAFERKARDESQALLERLDRWLAARDTEPRSLGTPGARVGLGIYHFRDVHPDTMEDGSGDVGTGAAKNADADAEPGPPDDHDTNGHRGGDGDGEDSRAAPKRRGEK